LSRTTNGVGLGALFLLCALAFPDTGSGYVLIANKSLAGAAISAEDVKQIFLGAKTSLAGRNVEPVIARYGSIHKEFAANCLGKTEAGLQNYFRMLLFTGKGNLPRSFATTAEIVDYVAKTEGAIGYVSRGADLNGVIVLEPY
jgi:hypothetical protein